MKRKIVMAFTVALLVTAVASAHDLFMRLDSYFLAPNTRACVRLLNGTFDTLLGYRYHVPACNIRPNK